MEALSDSVIKLFRVNELVFLLLQFSAFCLLPCAKGFELRCAEQYFNARHKRLRTFCQHFSTTDAAVVRQRWRPNVAMTSSPWRLGLIRPQISLLFSKLACQKQQRSCCQGIPRPAVHSAAQFVVRVPMQTAVHH